MTAPITRPRAKETAHSRRPPFARGASSSTAFFGSRTLLRFRLVVDEKQNRLNSSFKLSSGWVSHDQTQIISCVSKNLRKPQACPSMIHQ